jgi:hypothetical protein
MTSFGEIGEHEDEKQIRTQRRLSVLLPVSVSGKLHNDRGPKTPPSFRTSGGSTASVDELGPMMDTSKDEEDVDVDTRPDSPLSVCRLKEEIVKQMEGLTLNRERIITTEDEI